MPIGGAILLPPLGQKYPAGIGHVGSMLQYTNRGVGMTSPQVRFNCRPEITVLSLVVA
jgi:predicted MPP superfamily phosphohydrolase